ncbi:Nitrous oxide reductase maturation protein NosD [hydrothermal vent metagenome]|uniref:Nitrous oxide reductase maturation protein NosD n=1 Tax=hydrothermal vent metagenome TaxID=652676 RepID=A0A3B0RY32_9ZZZZ
MRRLVMTMVLGLLAGTFVSVTATAAEVYGDLQAIVDASAPGSVVMVEPGIYAGGITIDKPLTLRGSGWPVVDGRGSGTVITITAPDVTIEGLVVRGSGTSLDREDTGISVKALRVTLIGNRLEDVLFGIYLLGARDSVITDNVVGSKEHIFIANRGDGLRLWESDRSLVERNVVRNGRDAVFWFTDDVVLRDNEITGGRYGLHFMYSDRVVVEGNHLVDNSVGSYMMYSVGVTFRNNVFANNTGPSGYGIGFKDMDDYVVEGNRFIANRAGLYLDNSPSSADAEGLVRNNLFAYNQVGALFLPAIRNNMVYGNSFIDNVEQVGVTTTGTFKGNDWSVDGRGNYWSDFAGYDANGDGIGDVSYRVDDLYNTLTDKYPDLQFFQDTPAAKAIALAAEMFPVLRPLPLVEDRFPLIKRPELPPIRRLEAVSQAPALALASILMLIGASLVLRIPSRRQRAYLTKEPIA